MLAYALKTRGFAVSTAGNGADAVQEVRNGKFDVALTDLTMPGSDGIEVLKQLKAIDPELTIIVASGFAPPEAVERAREEGAFDFINKPFQIGDLCKLIDRAVAARKQP